MKQSLKSLLGLRTAIISMGPRSMGRAEYDKCMAEVQAEIDERTKTAYGKRRYKEVMAEFAEIKRQHEELDYKFDSHTSGIDGKTTYTIKVGSFINTCTFKPHEIQPEQEWINEQLDWFKKYFKETGIVK